MIVRIFNTDDEIDLKDLFNKQTAYNRWLKENPDVKAKQTFDRDYLDFENDADAMMFKLRFGLHDK